MNKKERKLFNENSLIPIITLFCLSENLSSAVEGLVKTTLLSDEEKEIVRPMLDELFSIDKPVRDILAAKRLNPLEIIESLRVNGYEIKQVK